MGEEKQNRTALIAVITGIVALLLGLCLGAMIGGAGGYLIGRAGVAKSAVTPALPRVIPTWPRLPIVPTPAVPQTPERLRPGGLIPRSGALIQEVLPDTPADKAGLRVGDVITQIQNTPVDANHRLADVLAQYKPGQQTTLTIWRMGSTHTVTVTLGEHPDNAQRPYLGIRYSELAPQRLTPQPGD